MNIYAEVTERILSELRAGVVPWRKTWANGLPKSLATGNEHRGHNVFLLATNAYQSRYWVTFNQAKRLGGNVRDGEKATPIYYWHWRTTEETEKLAEKLGKTSLAPCTAFTSFVFNLEQVEGIERPKDDFSENKNDMLEAAENLIASMPRVVEKTPIKRKTRHHPRGAPPDRLPRANPERRAFYELAWYLGASQSDIAFLDADNIDWQQKVIAYSRKKTGQTAFVSFGEEVASILAPLPTKGPLFPYLRRVRPSDRATEFKQRCQRLGIQGITLHSYRYAWAERARALGFPERFAQEALGHNSKAVHRAYAKKAKVTIPALENFHKIQTNP